MEKPTFQPSDGARDVWIMSWEHMMEPKKWQIQLTEFGFIAVDYILDYFYNNLGSKRQATLVGL